MEAKIFNQKGKESGSIKLPESIFGVKWNADLVHQVVTSMLTNKRGNVAHAKTRGEVRGGGKKPWKQKGTGRARHGSSRSPIWVGGGVTHGPRNDKNYDRKVNKTMKAKALFTILTKKLQDNELVFVDSLIIAEPKTKEAVEICKSISNIPALKGLFEKRNNSAYIATFNNDIALSKSFRNIGNVKLDNVKNINPVDIMNYKYIIVANPEESISFLSGKLDKSVKAENKIEKVIEKKDKTEKKVSKKSTKKVGPKSSKAKK